MQPHEDTVLVQDARIGAGMTVLTLAAATVFGVIGLGLLLVMPIAGIVTGGVGGLLLAGVVGSHLER